VTWPQDLNTIVIVVNKNAKRVSSLQLAMLERETGFPCQAALNFMQIIRTMPAETLIKNETSVMPGELQRRINSGVPAQLLDVRTPAEHAGVSIPGSRLLPLDSLDPVAFFQERGCQSTPIYVICQTGGRAKRAIEKLRRAGVEDCVLVEGGIEAWIHAGLPVNRGSGKVIPLMRQVQIIVGFLSALGACLALTLNVWFAIIPLLMGCGLFFAGVTGFCGLALVLAKMPWNNSVPSSAVSCCATSAKS
jgi:rhodanese-related sulfurtransferase